MVSTANQLRGKSAAELQSELLELRREQFNLRMQQATAQLSNVSRFKQVRREIARIKTLLGEKARTSV